MPQTMGIFPELSDNQRKHLRDQLVPKSRRVKKPMPKKPKSKMLKPGVNVAAPNIPVDNPGGMQAPKISSAVPMRGGTSERRDAARRKAGRY